MLQRNKQPIAILMATYNGEKYIRKQLDTIFAQDESGFTLYVRDDGSIDNTSAILKEYQTIHDNIVVIDNKGCNLGPQMNFMELLKQVESDYYMLADQDDLWHPDKVRNAYNKIRLVEATESGPALVLTNLRLCDSEDCVTADSFWKNIHFDPKLFNDLRSYIFINFATGCTMMFNHRVKDVAFPIPDYSPMHDWWLMVCVYQNGGKVGFISEPQIDYRKHGKNVTGDYVATQSGKSFLVRIQELFALYRLARKCHVVRTFVDFLYHKYRIKHLRTTI